MSKGGGKINWEENAQAVTYGKLFSMYEQKTQLIFRKHLKKRWPAVAAY